MNSKVTVTDVAAILDEWDHMVEELVKTKNSD